MEQKYFLQKNNEKQGPFSIKELEERKISRTDLVWYHGLDKWKKAKDIQELDILFKFTPPPINNKSLLGYKSLLKNSKLEIDKNKVLKTLSFLKIIRKPALYSILVWIVSFLIIFFSLTSELRSEIKKFESKDYQDRIEKELARVSEQYDTARRVFDEGLNKACPVTKLPDYLDESTDDVITLDAILGYEYAIREKPEEERTLHERYLLNKYDNCREQYKRQHSPYPIYHNSNSTYHPQFEDLERLGISRHTIIYRTSNYTTELISRCRVNIENHGVDSSMYSFWITLTTFILFLAVPYLKKTVILK